MGLTKVLNTFFVLLGIESTYLQKFSQKMSHFSKKKQKAQDLAGADYIDVNPGTFVGEEVERIKSPKELFNQIKELQ